LGTTICHWAVELGATGASRTLESAGKAIEASGGGSTAGANAGVVNATGVLAGSVFWLQALFSGVERVDHVTRNRNRTG
jgi:hypothetical protein